MKKCLVSSRGFVPKMGMTYASVYFAFMAYQLKRIFQLGSLFLGKREVLHIPAFQC